MVTKLFKRIFICVIVLFIIIVGCFSFAIVPTGYTGVRTTFGQIDNVKVNSGINFKIPFVQSISIVNNKQQDFLYKDTIFGESSDRTVVKASNVTVTYQISREKSVWIHQNVSSSNELITGNMISTSIKSATVQLATNEVTNRGKLQPIAEREMQNTVNAKYGEGTVSIVKIIIESMDFEDSYNDAIAKKQIAQQKYEQQQIDNKKALEKAEADKKVAILNAQASAEAKLIAAKAEAEANKKVANSLTDRLLKSKYYDKWNGELPKVSGSNGTIIDIGGLEDEE